MDTSLTFPTRQSVGEVTYSAPGSNELFRNSATGTVWIPPNAVVSLEIWQEGRLDLSFLDALPPDAISAISFEPDDSKQLGLHDLLHIAAQRSLNSLDVSEIRVTQEAAPAIASLTSLRDLALTDGAISDSFLLKPISELTSLSSLSLKNNELSGNALSLLCGLRNLEWLNIAGLGLIDEHLWFLTCLDRITDLFVNQNPVSDAALIYMTPLTGLKRLRSSHTNITQGGLNALWHVIGDAGGAPEPLITLIWEGPGWYAATATPWPPWHASTSPDILVHQFLVTSDDEAASCAHSISLTAPAKLSRPSDWHGPVTKVV